MDNNPSQARVIFAPFPKMARLTRECIITEKIDGTNASITITDDGQFLVGSRTRFITPSDDNFGFAAWAYKHKDELMTLGPGTHFGEWWGRGIQRNYGLDHRRFSLFNVTRWVLHGQTPNTIGSANPTAPAKLQGVLPPCVGLVPVLERAAFDTTLINATLERLKFHGSQAAPGFTNPEGIVVYHVAAGVGFKKTIEKDELPKSQTL